MEKIVTFSTCRVGVEWSMSSRIVSQPGETLHRVQYPDMSCPTDVHYHHNVIYVCDRPACLCQQGSALVVYPLTHPSKGMMRDAIVYV